MSRVAKINKLISQLTCYNSNKRYKTAVMLKKMGEPYWYDILSIGLEDTFKFLARSEDKRAIVPILKGLKSKHEFIRRYSIEALGDRGDPIAVEPLIETLKDSDDILYTIPALAKINDKRAYKPLVKIYYKSSRLLREKCIDAIRAINNHELFSIFAENLDSQDKEKLIDTMRAFSRFKEISDPDTFEKLKTLLLHEDLDIRGRAGAALKSLGETNWSVVKYNGDYDIGAISRNPVLVSMIKDKLKADNPIDNNNYHLIKIFSRVCDTDDVFLITPYLDNKSTYTKRLICEVLGNLINFSSIDEVKAAGKSEEYTKILKLLPDANTDLRIKAAELLVKWGDTRWKGIEGKSYDFELIGRSKDSIFIESLHNTIASTYKKINKYQGNLDKQMRELNNVINATIEIDSAGLSPLLIEILEKFIKEYIGSKKIFEENEAKYLNFVKNNSSLMNLPDDNNNSESINEYNYQINYLYRKIKNIGEQEYIDHAAALLKSMEERI